MKTIITNTHLLGRATAAQLNVNFGVTLLWTLFDPHSQEDRDVSLTHTTEVILCKDLAFKLPICMDDPLWLNVIYWGEWRACYCQQRIIY